MSAVILPFAPTSSSRAAPRIASGDQPPILSCEWADQHLPLIEAALLLLHADDAEFERRCCSIAKSDGRHALEALSAQLERLGSHIGDVVEALDMTVTRIRTTMAAAVT